MAELCLDLCDMSDEGVKHFFDCVGKIEKLSLHRCIDSSETSSRLKELYRERLVRY